MTLGSKGDSGIDEFPVLLISAHCNGALPNLLTQCGSPKGLALPNLVEASDEHSALVLRSLTL